jgi:Family of unknown function (DUF6603)
MEYARIEGPEAVLASVNSRAGVIVVGGRLKTDGSRCVLAYLADGVRADLAAAGLTVTLLVDQKRVAENFSVVRAQVGQGPTQGSPRMRGEFSAELIQAALIFARVKANELATEALGSAQALANKLDIPPTGLPNIDVELEAVVRAISLFSSAVEKGVALPSLDLAKIALAPLAATIAALEKAVFKLGGDATKLTALLSGVFSNPMPGLGVLQQLGLPAGPGGIMVAAGTVAYTIKKDNPNILGVKADSVGLSAVARYKDGPASLALTLRIEGLRLALPAVGSLLNELGIGNGAIAVDVIVTVDTVGGLTIGGANQGRIALPARKQLGPLKVKGLALDIGHDGPRLLLDLVALAEGNLGPPVRLTVDGAGLRFIVDPGQSMPIQPPTVKLPTGFGVDINAGPARGGGYLSITSVPGHPDWTRYGGALNLRMGPIEVKAFGLITDRPDGFSFVVVMSVELYPPIELGLLFTLNGVGGILGVEVAADTEAMRARLRSGALGNLLFPADPIASAPNILDTLAAVFPAQSGGFVVGPMLKLGWGRPISFVTAELALILSLPDVKVLLLGRLRLAIPAPQLPLIDLRADVYGEFSDDRVLLLVSLVDSRVGFFAVQGDFGLLLRFGSDPTFVLSAGGFHPRYTPPAELNALRRITAELSPPIFQMRIEAYAAVTTNSVQFGGRLELRYGIGGTGVFGYLALDALIRWAPRFGFEVDIAAGIAVRAFGISVASVALRLHLEGPGPWKAWGTGEVGLPWPLPDVSIDVGPVTWGETSDPPAQLVSPRHLVREALSQPAAWQTSAPGRRSGVRLREEPVTDPGTILVEPWSLLEGRQAVVPLDTDIVRIGSSRIVPGENRISIDGPDFTHAGAAASATSSHSPVTDRFAPGHYLDLPEDQQMRRPSFESFPAGVRVDPGGESEVPGPKSECELRYETSFPQGPRKFVVQLVDTVKGNALLLGATAAGSSSLREADRYAVAAEGLHIAGPEMVLVRSRTDLSVVSGVASTPMTWTHAEHVAAAATSAAGQLQVVALGAV